MAFLTTAAFSFSGALFFGILATADEESWSKRSKSKGSAENNGEASKEGSLSALFTASIH